MQLDVSKFQLDGEWLELRIKSKEGEKTLRIKLKPLSTEDQLDMAEVGGKDIKEFFVNIKDVVLDWDLKTGEEALPCTDENKKKYLPFLITLKLAEDTEKEEGAKSIVGYKIMEFAQNFDNFIKN